MKKLPWEKLFEPNTRNEIFQVTHDGGNKVVLRYRGYDYDELTDTCEFVFWNESGDRRYIVILHEHSIEKVEKL